MQTGVSEPTDGPLLSFPDDGRVVATRRSSMAVEAVVGQIHLAPDKPARPGDAVARIQNGVKRSVELDPEVFDNSGPEPLDIGRRPGDQLTIVGNSVPLHEAADIRIIDDLLARFPGVWFRHETSKAIQGSHMPGTAAFSCTLLARAIRNPSPQSI